MDATQSAPSTKTPVSKPPSPPRADIGATSGTSADVPVSAGDITKERETVIIDDDTVSNTRADTVIPDTTSVGNLGASTETSRTPNAPESPQQPPLLSL
jgi:hypothetical protein